MKRENYKNYKWYPLTDEEYWVEEYSEEFPNCNTIVIENGGRFSNVIKTYQNCSIGWSTMAKNGGFYFMIVDSIASYCKQDDSNNILENVWKKYSLKEILEAGYETESIQAIDIIKEAEEIEKESFKASIKSNFIDNLRELFNDTPSREFPFAEDIMDEISVHYDTDTLLDCFNIDELIEHCDNSWQMDDYICDKCNDAVEKYIETHQPVTEQTIITSLQDCSKDNLKRFICDVLGVIYHTPNDELIELLKKQLD